ncbi:MAG: helix-turn-helix transcriptional regulator [Pseudomonadota bacterium]
MPRPLKAPHVIDEHVGRRLRIRRKQSGLSQHALGDAIGLTFQQVQKYERGGNRISASRLYEIADFLKVPVSYFFEGVVTTGIAKPGENLPPVNSDKLLEVDGGIDLARDFPRIRSPRIRQAIAKMVAQIADEDEDGAA